MFYYQCPKKPVYIVRTGPWFLLSLPQESGTTSQEPGQHTKELWLILPRKSCLLTGCNKQHISSSAGFPDYQTHATSQSALKCDTWILYLEFLDIIFELEMTRERKWKNKACGHKMLYQFRRKISRKLKNDIDKRWNQEVRQWYTDEKREYGVCFSYYCI